MLTLLISFVEKAQFVLLGEDHMDHSDPACSPARCTPMLHRAGHGVHAPGRRAGSGGDRRCARAATARTHAGSLRDARAYPSLYEFDTDEDLALPGARRQSGKGAGCHLGRRAGDGRSALSRRTGGAHAGSPERAKNFEKVLAESARGGSRAAVLGQLAHCRGTRRRRSHHSKAISRRMAATRTQRLFEALTRFIDDFRLLPASRGRRVRRVYTTTPRVKKC